MRKRLRNILSSLLSPEELSYVFNSYDIVGDIAILRLNEPSLKYGKAIASVIMNVHKNVKTVLIQTSPVQGDFRLRRLEYAAGEDKTSTIHKEFGCLFSVDISKCYFSPRLFYERMRIAKHIKNGETVVNMFAGVGCFSIVIAKHSNVHKVYSIDINPACIKKMQENIKLNRVYGKVVPMLGDAKDVVEKQLRNKADRVLMPLPEKALEYLPYALKTLKDAGGLIHFYDFEHAKKNENLFEKTKLKVAQKLGELGVSFEFLFNRVVRSTGPNWYQIVLDIFVKR